MVVFSKLEIFQNGQNTLLKHMILSFLRNFLFGFSVISVKTAFSFLQHFISSHFSKKPKFDVSSNLKTSDVSHSPLREKPLKSFDLSRFVRDAFQTGSFFALWSLIFQVLIRVLNRGSSSGMIPTPSSLFISGALSGFTSMYVTQGIGWQIALYFLIRSFASFLRINIHVFPNWIQKFPDVLIYAIINSVFSFSIGKIVVHHNH